MLTHDPNFWWPVLFYAFVALVLWWVRDMLSPRQNP